MDPRTQGGLDRWTLGRLPHETDDGMAVPKAAGSALPPDPAILFAGAKPAQNAESLPQALCSWSICATNRGES